MTRSPADTLAVLADAHDELGGAVALSDLLDALGVVPVEVRHGHHVTEEELRHESAGGVLY